MAKRLKIPIELLNLHPHLNVKIMRTIINTILGSRRNRMRQAHIFDIRLPKLGRIRSNANKIHKHSKKTLVRDKRRKRIESRNKELKRENLLY